MDPRTPVGDLDRLAYELRKMKDRIDEIASPSGTMAYQSVAKLQALVNDIQAQLDDYIANGTYNKAQIDSKIASPGAIAPTSLTVSGGLSAPGAASTTMSTYASAVWNAAAGSNGQLGRIPSIRAAKTSIRPAPVDVERFLEPRAQLFQYIEDVAVNGEKARTDRGFIAEDVQAAGFTEALYSDPTTGELAGINYDRLAPILWDVLQQVVTRLAVVERKVTDLEDRL